MEKLELIKILKFATFIQNYYTLTEIKINGERKNTLMADNEKMIENNNESESNNNQE